MAAFYREGSESTTAIKFFPFYCVLRRTLVYRYYNYGHTHVKRLSAQVQSTDHELFPARNASVAAMQGSASGSNVRYYPP
jgi:hypothetical protein